MASGAAVALLEAGCQVIMAEVAHPCTVRRLGSFGTAVDEGRILVAGWSGTLVGAEEVRYKTRSLAVVVDPQAELLARLGADYLVDARMIKRRPPPLPWTWEKTVGLGPGFWCGDNAALVVETQRGENLGAVIEQGAAAPYTGVPGQVAGHTVERLLRAPIAGRLLSSHRIGDLVDRGEVVGQVGSQPVVCGVSGCLRGLVHPLVELSAGQKVGDVDPRGHLADPTEMTDKARRIGQGVVQAIGLLASGPALSANKNQSQNVCRDGV